MSNSVVSAANPPAPTSDRGARNRSTRPIGRQVRCTPWFTDKGVWVAVRRIKEDGKAYAALGVVGLVSMIALLMVPAVSEARSARVSMSASITDAGVLVAKGRVRPARSSWRVRVETRSAVPVGRRTRNRWIRRADSARLPSTGRFSVRTRAGGTSAVVRVRVLSGRRTVARSRAVSVVARNPTTTPGGGAGGSPAAPGTVPPPATSTPSGGGSSQPSGGTTPPSGGSPTPPSPRTELSNGGLLNSGEQLISPNGAYRLVMQTDGNLVLYKGSQALWATGGQGSGARAVMQADGNLVVYNGSTAKWSSSTGGFDASILKIQDDGNLVIYDAGRAIWSWAGGYGGHVLAPGQQLAPGRMVRSPNGSHRLVMQTDGNLVLYRGSQALWSTGGMGSGSRLVMQTDGNLVVYNGSTPKWSSNGSGFGGANLVVQDDGNAVVYHSGHAIWTWGAGYTGDTLNAGASLAPGAYLKSPNHAFTLIMQPADSNLVIYGPSGAVWGWGSDGQGGASAIMQTDGNFVVQRGSTVLRNTGTGGKSGAYVRMQDDDNLVVYLGSTPLWSRKDTGGLQLPWPAGQVHRILAAGNGYGCNTHVGRSQYALDFDLTTGQAVAAVGAGTARSGTHDQLGNYVWIDHGGGLVSIYAHLSPFSGGFPRQVARGETIGAAGNTGLSFGAHLHLALRSGATGPFDGNAYMPEPMSGYSGFGAYGCDRATSPLYTAR